MADAVMMAATSMIPVVKEAWKKKELAEVVGLLLLLLLVVPFPFWLLTAAPLPNDDVGPAILPSLVQLTLAIKAHPASAVSSFVQPSNLQSAAHSTNTLSAKPCTSLQDLPINSASLLTSELCFASMHASHWVETTESKVKVVSFWVVKQVIKASVSFMHPLSPASLKKSAAPVPFTASWATVIVRRRSRGAKNRQKEIMVVVVVVVAVVMWGNMCVAVSVKSRMKKRERSGRLLME
jgi:hypothetical protein